MKRVLKITADGAVTDVSHQFVDAEVGRPTDDPKDERVDVRLNKREKAKFLSLGGSSWLRKQLAKH